MDTHKSTTTELVEPTLGDTAIYYRFAFTVGVEIHPNEAARRCLKAELALTAVDAWGSVSVTPSMVSALNTLGRLRETARLTKGRWAVPRFMLRHPLLSARVLVGRRMETERPTGSAKPIDDTVDELRELVAHLAVLDGLASQVDQDVLRPHYLATEPWIRLALPPFTVRHRDQVDRHTLDANLLLHRSGQAVMTFGLLFEAPDGDAGIDQVNAWANGSGHNLVATTLDLRLLEQAFRSTRAPIGGELDQHDGRSTVSFDHQTEPVSLGDIFNVYRDALVECVTGQPLPDELGEYHMIPMISIRGLDDVEHDRVGPLLSMHVRTEHLTRSAFRSPDTFAAAMRTYAADVWTSMACVVHLAKNSFRSEFLDAKVGQVPGEAWLRAEGPVCLAVDLALLRLGLTDTLSERLAASTSARELETVSRSALAHFELLSGERLLRVGELSQIEEVLLAHHNFAAQRAAFAEQRELASAVASSMQTRKSQRLARRTEAFVIILTVVVALTGSIGVLLQLTTWDDRFVVAGQPFGDWGRWALVAVPAALLVVYVGVLVGWPIVRSLLRRLHADKTRPLGPRPKPSRRQPSGVPLGGLRFVADDGIEQPGARESD